MQESFVGEGFHSSTSRMIFWFQCVFPRKAPGFKMHLAHWLKPTLKSRLEKSEALTRNTEHVEWPHKTGSCSFLDFYRLSQIPFLTEQSRKTGAHSTDLRPGVCPSPKNPSIKIIQIWRLPNDSRACLFLSKEKIAVFLKEGFKFNPHEVFKKL